MQHKEIRKFIKEINNKSLNIKDLVSISKNVDYCKVYGNKISEDRTSWFKFFFIKSINEYVGAVNDMGYLDLHWYIMPSY